MEAWRGMGEMGFPWCLSGSAWIGTPVMGLAAACGELGLGAATILTAAAVLAALSLAGRYSLQAGGAVHPRQNPDEAL